MNENARSHSHQLILELAGEPQFGVEDFLISACNEQAFDMIELWPDWPDRVVLLQGPAGAGKSHLAAIWARRAGALPIDAAVLAGVDPPVLAQRAALLIEDAERIAGAEAALFHLLNLVRTTGASLLMTSRHAPDRWGVKTADLLSRLRLAPCVAIDTPDEALIRAVLVKLFFDRQLMVDTGLIEFAARRLDRDLGAARNFVAALDREALARGRRITRPLANQVLTTLEEAAQASADRETEGNEHGRASPA